jgi:P-type E1-E2 ATPase
MVVIDIPGRDSLELEYLVLDVNGTLTRRGVLLEGVSDRIVRLGSSLQIQALSADTFGTFEAITAELGIAAHRIGTGEEKARHVAALGAERCVAIGNGANDAPMLETAALGIAVIGPEGAASTALRAADIVCASIIDALDLLLDDRALVAMLRI